MIYISSLTSQNLLTVFIIHFIEFFCFLSFIALDKSLFVQLSELLSRHSDGKKKCNPTVLPKEEKRNSNRSTPQSLHSFCDLYSWKFYVCAKIQPQNRYQIVKFYFAFLVLDE